MGLHRWFSQITDPINMLELFEEKDSLKNVTNWQNSQYQNILKKYRNTSTKPLKQLLLAEAEALLKNEVPAFPLCYCQYTYLQQPYIKNLAISPIGLMHFDQIIIDPKEKKPYLEACI